jgi:glucose/mannose-6-phosphate isomerase
VKQLIADFSRHLEDALQTIEQTTFEPAPREIHQVLITGLGGSGIGGSIVADLAAPLSKVPIVVNKDYLIPAFVGKHTLVIACSYSGNTEETLTAVKSAIDQGAMVACITSGGQLKELATQYQFNQIGMQGGNPPRSMFGYAFTYLAFILNHYGIVEFAFADDIAEAIALLNTEEANTKRDAEKMAEQLKGKTTQILAVAGNLGIAARMRQQLNENAKMLAWEAEIPEMNHNELVGWEGGTKQYAALFLRNHSDYARNQKRIEIIKEIIGSKTDTVLELWSKGTSELAKAAYLVHFGDWVSYYLSEINQVDILDIKSIDLLKSELGKVPF